MLELTGVIPALPLFGALLLALAPRTISKRFTAVVGVGSIGLAAALALVVVPPAVAANAAPYTEVIWNWIDVARLQPRIAFYLDPISLLMIVVVTFVAFMIHLYSAEFMESDEGYARFFAYMNLFVGSMLILVLADNLLLLYLGWEGVGLCSYLLIGFWYRDPANGAAARKAFFVTRAGDTALLIGLFVIYRQLGTLRIQDAMQRAAQLWPAGSIHANVIAALLLAGAVGKSAQLPLQVWLPDAMAGPTPTSALIHAATMVTAGVYLIARTHVFFALAPDVQFTVAAIGGATLLLAGFSALTQHDIKRVLAYSTISQIGYMFLALGVGAWTAALFHFMTHAFFKALLFLAAGVVIAGVRQEHDIFKMGGLRKEFPVAFWGFLIGGSALSGLPLVTAGYYSKDLIIWGAWTTAHGSPGFWGAGIAGAFLTAMYTFRLIFLVFFGEAHSPVTQKPGVRIVIPIAILSFLAIVGGAVETPLRAFLSRALPALTEAHMGTLNAALSSAAAGLAFVSGFFFAWLFFFRKPEYTAAAGRQRALRALHEFWFSDWGMDWLYDRLFVRPYVWLANVARNDAVGNVFSAIGRANEFAWHELSLMESGRVRWYAASIGFGVVILVAVALLT